MNAASIDATWLPLETERGTGWATAAMQLLVAEAAEAPAEAAAQALCDAAAIAAGLPDGAAQADALYHEAQVRCPGDPLSAEGIALGAEARGDWRAVAEWTRIGLAHATEPGLRLRLLSRLVVALQDHRRGDDAEVRAVLAEALQLAPNDAGLAARLALASDEGAATPEALDAQIAAAPPGGHAARLRLARGAQRREAGDLAGALLDFEAAAAADPSLSTAWAARCQLLVRGADWPALVSGLSAWADQLPPGLERGRTRYIAALYAAGRLQDPARAAALLTAARSDLAGRVDTGWALAHWEAGGASAPDAPWADRPLPVVEDASASLAGEALLQAVAARRAGADAEAGDALSAASGSALGALWAQDRAWAALARADHEAARIELDAHLADPWGPSGSAVGWRAAWSVASVGWPAASPQDAEGRLTHWRFRRALAALRGDAAVEALAARQVVEAAPESPWARVAALSAGVPADSLLVVAGAGSPAVQARLGALAAQRAAAAGDQAVVEAGWALAASADPAAIAPRIAVGRAHAKAGRWATVIEGFARAAEAGDTEAAARAAELRWARLQATEGVVADLAAGPHPAWRWLAAEVAGQTAHVEDAAAVHAALADELDPTAPTADLAVERGWVAGLSPSADALRALQQAAPNAPAVAWLLEAHARRGGAPLPADHGPAEGTLSDGLRRWLDDVERGHPSPRLPAAPGTADATTLAYLGWHAARQAAVQGDWSSAADHLTRLAGQLPLSNDGWWLLRLAAELTEASGASPEAQVAAWDRVLAVHTDTPRAWRGLLAAHSADPAAEAATAVRVARLVPSPRDNAALLWRAALLEEARDPALAAELLDDAAVAWDAATLPGLLRWFGLVGPTPEGAAREALALSLLGRVRSPRLGARLLVAAAEAVEATGGPAARALAHRVEAARRRPQDVLLAEAAERGLAEARAWGPLADYLTGRLAALTEREARLGGLRALAEVQLAHLKDRPAARATWAEIVTLDGQDPEAHATLADICFGLEAFEAAATHYEAALALGLPGREAGRLHLRAGRLRARRLNDVAGAVRHLEAAIAGGAAGAEEALAEILLTHGRAGEAIARYARLAEAAPDPVQRTLARAGWVRALMVDGRRGEAQAQLTAALAEDPGDPQLAALRAELGPAAPPPRDYRAVLDGVALEDGAEWAGSLDLAPLAGGGSSDSLSADPLLGAGVGDAAAALGDALAAMDAALSSPAGEGPDAALHDPADALAWADAMAEETEAAAAEIDALGRAVPPEVAAALAVDPIEASPTAAEDGGFEAEAPTVVRGAPPAEALGFEVEAPTVVRGAPPAEGRGFEAEAPTEVREAPAADALGFEVEGFDAEASTVVQGTLAAEAPGFEAEAHTVVRGTPAAAAPGAPGGAAPALAQDADVEADDNLDDLDLAGLGDLDDPEAPDGSLVDLDLEDLDPEPVVDLPLDGPGADRRAGSLPPLPSVSVSADAALSPPEGSSVPPGLGAPSAPPSSQAPRSLDPLSFDSLSLPDLPSAPPASAAPPAAQAPSAPAESLAPLSLGPDLASAPPAAQVPSAPAESLAPLSLGPDLASAPPAAQVPSAPAESLAPLSLGPDLASAPPASAAPPAAQVPSAPAESVAPLSLGPDLASALAEASVEEATPAASASPPATPALPLGSDLDPVEPLTLIPEDDDLWEEPSLPAPAVAAEPDALLGAAGPPADGADDDWGALDGLPLDGGEAGEGAAWAELDLAPQPIGDPAGDAPWLDLDDPFEGDVGPPAAAVTGGWTADGLGLPDLSPASASIVDALVPEGPLSPTSTTPPPLPPAPQRAAGRGQGVQDRAAEARIRIAREPLAVAGWLMLAEAEAADPSASAWLADVIGWLQGRITPPAPALNPGEPVPESVRRSMLTDGVPPNLLLLLRSVGPSVAPAFGPVSGREQGGRRIPDHEPLADLVRRLSRVLDVPPVQLLLNDVRPYTVAAEAGDPHRVILGTAVFDGADAAGASFLVARTLIPLREGTLPATVLSDREFRAFLAALFDMLDASFPVRSRDRATMERIRGWLDPLLAVHQRLAWEPLAHAAVSGMGTRSAARVRVGLELYSARLALSVADGFAGAMEMLRLLDFDDRPRAELGRADLEQFLADNDLARDLLVFAASPACLNARRWRTRTGLKPT